MRICNAKDTAPFFAKVKNGFKNFIWEEEEREGDIGKINKNVYLLLYL